MCAAAAGRQDTGRRDSLTVTIGRCEDPSLLHRQAARTAAPGGSMVDEPRPTEWINLWAAGNEEAAEQVVELFAGELTKIARATLARSGSLSNELCPQELVSELYLRMQRAFAGSGQSFENRRLFFGYASQALRRVLLDMAKRGGKNRPRLTSLGKIDDNPEAGPDSCDLIDLKEALAELEAIDESQAFAVWRHYYVGQTIEEVAEELNLSRASVNRRIKLGMAFLRARLGDSA